MSTYSHKSRSSQGYRYSCVLCTEPNEYKRSSSVYTHIAHEHKDEAGRRPRRLFMKRLNPLPHTEPPIPALPPKTNSLAKQPKGRQVQARKATARAKALDQSHALTGQGQQSHRGTSVPPNNHFNEVTVLGTQNPRVSENTFAPAANPYPQASDVPTL